MGERKVIQQYFAPDFDPSKVPRRKRARFNRQESRIMLPFSLQCSTCGEFMYQGKKFNATKEDIDGEDGRYLGIQRYRFVFKCSMCSSPIAFVTDPKNTDYAMEYGATRNFEHWKIADEVREAEQKKKEEEEKGDAMKALENRTLDSKLELEILDGLETIQAMNRRSELANARVDTQAILDRIDERTRKKEEKPEEVDLADEDEELIRATVFRNSALDKTVETPKMVLGSSTGLMPPPKVPSRIRVKVSKKAGTAKQAKKAGRAKQTKTAPVAKTETGKQGATTSQEQAKTQSVGNLLGYSDSSEEESE